MTSLPSYKAPFIFANWNNTSGDVDVLTHECGHAFEGYVAERDPAIPADLDCPGMESAEIHSMAMEFLTAPWHHLLFGQMCIRDRHGRHPPTPCGSPDASARPDCWGYSSSPARTPGIPA